MSQDGLGKEKRGATVEGDRSNADESERLQVQRLVEIGENELEGDCGGRIVWETGRLRPLGGGVESRGSHGGKGCRKRRQL